jgi:DNA-binding HxlR family transcriptional regulator
MDHDPRDAARTAAATLDPDELGDRLRAATPTGRRLFTLLSRSGTLEVLYAVGMHGPIRCSELKDRLDISSATLSARLSELLDAGFVDRTSYDENPPRVEYTPTERLADLKPVLCHFVDWVERHQVSLDESATEERPDPLTRVHSPGRLDVSCGPGVI